MKKSLYSFSVAVFALLALAVLTGCQKQPVSPIRLNQVGFSPKQEKTATVVTDEPILVHILNAKGDTVLTATSQELKAKENPISGKHCQIVDF